jgi:acetoacetyl-CoA synthetase
MSNERPLWQPSATRAAATLLARFMQRAGCKSYDELHRWSVERREDFWTLVWDFCGVRGTRAGPVLVEGDRMPGARWFAQARLNFAENLLRERGDGEALAFWGEESVKRRFTHRQLHALVSRLAQALRAAGVNKGDRVAGYLPNLPEAIAATLATASLGAIWSSCSPDFGVQGVLDRFGQIEPRLLLVVDGYWYNGKAIPVASKVAEIVAGLPTVERVIVVPYLERSGGPRADLSGIRGAVRWDDFLAPHAAGPLEFARLPFDHPLYILYSSGTTGVPKCLIHGAGGTLLQHMKEHLLHCDLKPGDRLFYFTTCGWMMWNWLASALAARSTLLLFDGSPFIDRGRALWDLAQDERMTHFGTSAKYIDAAKKLGVVPRKDYGLAHLRTLLSTGSPLAPESFDYVYQCVKEDICLSSISGGTDVVACFALGNPTLPVWRGELQCRALAMAVDVYDEDGKSVPAGSGLRGELVCTAPFPSTPIGFWNDPDGAKYRAAYFERFPGVWTHGDYVELTAHDGMVIHGRSDATLNPGGVRIGTAEIYRQVEQLPEVVESLVIGQDWPPGEVGDVRVVLFVKLAEGVVLDEALVEKIRAHVRANTTPRHVPAKVLQVTDIPRTKSNKIVELAVRNVVHGLPVKNVEALANPEALEQYRDRPELRS